MATITIFDGNNIAMACAYTGRDMANDKGVLTGGLFNFLRSLKKIQTNYPSDKIIVAWDAANPWRKDILPTYKESRKQERSPQVEEWFRAFNFQRGEMKRMSMMLGVEHLTAPRQEADDIAGHLVESLTDDQITLVTNDNDWFQLVRPNVRVYRPLKEDFLTLENFQEVTNCVDPQEFIHAKSIIGDDGDDVPGVEGVGLITALKYIRGEIKSGKKVEAIQSWLQNPEGYDRTRKLVNLVKKIDGYDQFVEVMSCQKSSTDFVAACEEYQFGSIIKELPNWKELFGV